MISRTPTSTRTQRQLSATNAVASSVMPANRMTRPVMMPIVAADVGSNPRTAKAIRIQAIPVPSNSHHMHPVAGAASSSCITATSLIGPLFLRGTGSGAA